jgi:hypothetical protein
MNERGGLLVSEPVDDDYCDQVVDMRSERIVFWQYRQTDLPGSGLDSLRTPEGMDGVPLNAEDRPLWPAVHHP